MDIKDLIFTVYLVLVVVHFLDGYLDFDDWDFDDEGPESLKIIAKVFASALYAVLWPLLPIYVEVSVIGEVVAKIFGHIWGDDADD